MMERISDRVSIDRREGRTSVVISARTTPGKQTLLVTWAVAWIACGVIVIFERSMLPAGDPARQYMLAFLAFWAYFAVMIARAVLWRLKGFELWRIKDGALTIKSSVLGYGKAHTYFTANIEKLGLIAMDRDSWKWQWDQSVWVVGGERLGFEHLGKKVVFGRNLTDDEARQLVPVIKRALKEERKREEADAQG